MAGERKDDKSEPAERADSSGSGPVAIIHAFTSSVERIGYDAALIALIVILGFGAMAVGVHPLGALGFGLICWTMWMVTKYVSAYIDQQKADNELKRLQFDRGQKILEQHPDRQRRLLLPDGRGDENVQ